MRDLKSKFILATDIPRLGKETALCFVDQIYALSIGTLLLMLTFRFEINSAENFYLLAEVNLLGVYASRPVMR